MREFMDHITNSFFEATRWNRDNSYSELNAMTNGIHSRGCDVSPLFGNSLN